MIKYASKVPLIMSKECLLQRKIRGNFLDFYLEGLNFLEVVIFTPANGLAETFIFGKRSGPVHYNN